MRWAVASLVLACGCDSVFRVDVPVPPACPDVGTTAPAFSSQPQLVRADRCVYSESVAADLAVAACFFFGIFEGPISDPPTLPTPVDPIIGSVLLSAHVTPEGDRLFTTANPSAGAPSEVVLYARTGGQWTSPQVMPISNVGLADYASTASSIAAGRHLVLAHRNVGAPSTFDEWAERGATWTVVQTYTAATFGQSDIADPNLSADGLRMVFVAGPLGMQQVMYTDRARIDDPFTAATTILVPANEPSAPFLTSDCGRLYYTDDTSLHVVAQ